MKKYIAPAMECRKAMVQSLLTETSIPLSDVEVDGSEALGKYNLWNDDEEEY